MSECDSPGRVAATASKTIFHSRNLDQIGDGGTGINLVLLENSR